MKIIKNLEKKLSQGKDSPLLRFSLGSAYLKELKLDLAIEHLSRAVAMDENQSMAWKLLGQSYAANQQYDDARTAFEKSLEIATAKGNRRAINELKEFLARLNQQ